jgi:hypothetical protein
MDASAHENVTVDRQTPATYTRETVTVDLLFLDRTECDRCAGAAQALDAAVDRVAALLADLGVDLRYRQVHVESARDARRVGLSLSPTVRVDGRDLQPAAHSGICEDCTGLGEGESVPCRRWFHDGAFHTTPPVPLLVRGILRGAVGEAGQNRPEGADGAALSSALTAYFGEGSEAADGESTCC